MADTNQNMTWQMGMGSTGNKTTTGSSTAPTSDQWMSTGDGASITGSQSAPTTTTPTSGSWMGFNDGSSITGTPTNSSPSTTPAPQTWQSLNDYIQQQYAAQYDPSQTVGLDPSDTSVPDWQSQFGKATDGEGQSTGFGSSGFQLPGQQGTWTWDPANQQFLQQQTAADPQGVAGYSIESYNRLKQGADGNVASDNAYATRRSANEGNTGWFNKHWDQIVTTAVGVMAGGALAGVAAGGAGASAGTGAGVAADAGTAGWVSAEGGAGYAGGAAADGAAGTIGGGVANATPVVNSGSIYGSGSLPAGYGDMGITSGTSGTAGTGASGGVEQPQSWTSAENGAGYSNGSVVDNAAGNIGGAPVTSNPVPNTGNIYGGNTLPSGYGTPSTLGNLYDKAVTGLGNMTLGDYLKAGAGIGTAVKGYTNSQNTVANNAAYQQQINNMYAPGSPEYLALQQQMERQDAANGRNSQYGTRLAEMGAKIAQLKMQALTSPAYAGSVASTNQANSQDLNSLFALMGQAGNYIK